jgi:DNA-binding NtrC family response regulator
LYFRLNVARIHLPPLRDRREDIPLLLTHYLAVLRDSLAGAVQDFSAEALDALTVYDWPGNIRELKNVVERILMQGRSPVAGVADLPEELQVRHEAAAGMPTSERARLFAALTTAHGNKSEAARALRCSRMTLYRRMVRCGLRDGSRPTRRRG